MNGVMSLTVWSNHELWPAAHALFTEQVARLGCRLIQSPRSSRSVLAEGTPDPTLAEADVAYGQPAPEQIVGCPRLRWIALSTAGYTRYDRDEFRTAMRIRGTQVTNASGVFANPCAEHALAMMLALTRNLPREVLNGAGPRAWNYTEGRYTIGTLTGSTVVVLGFGAIGRRLAELLAPFRTRLIGVRRHPRGDEGLEMVRISEVHAVLPHADHVVNCLPDSPETRHFCNAAFLNALRPHACFYNIGRGTTVDQSALEKALRAGQLAGAFLDALDPEPLPPAHPLWSTPHCHVTPHLAGGHRGQDESLVRHFVANLERFLHEEPLTDRIV